MSRNDDKQTLVSYLQIARDAVVWKLDGLSEYDVRRPMTPTGTSLLGLVKHLASVELGYFGETFGRPSGIDLPWHRDDADPNDDRPLRERRGVQGVGRRPLPARLGARRGDIRRERPRCGRPRPSLEQPPGHPPPDPRARRHRDPPPRRARRRHPGADRRVRRFAPDDSNLPEDGYDWPAYVDRVERAARDAAGRG